VLLEFDADQRLWQETVRDAVTKQCPPTLVRAIAEAREGDADSGGQADPAPLWQAYIEQGWTELTDPENAVELAIVLEELGRVTDPTPFLATLSQFAPLVGDRYDPQHAGAAVYSGVTAHRDAGGWVLSGTAQYVLDADRAGRLAVVTDAGVFLVPADQVSIRRR
jgi:alkylation response protein AidB-like acyl-CoA dehydrogenase